MWNFLGTPINVSSIFFHEKVGIIISYTPIKKIARKSWNLTKISLYYLEYSIHDNIAKFRDIYSENLAIFDKRDFSLLNSEFRNSMAKFLRFIRTVIFHYWIAIFAILLRILKIFNGNLKKKNRKLKTWLEYTHRKNRKNFEILSWI